jgi:2-(1,2-epoxy-1,2-dihydrophenyl)acetyl-CoA isomerase
VGAGLSLALACDIRIGSLSSFVTTGYARVGLSGDYGISSLLTRAVGSGRARELMFTAERIDSKKCLELGIYNRIVADDELLDYSMSFAEELARGPRKAFALMKDNLDDALVLNFDASLDSEAPRLIEAMTSSDHKEAVRAFVEKRKPVFGGN